MKRLFVATTLLAIAISMTFAQGTANVTYVDHDKVATAIANGGALASGPDFAASMAKRSGPGQVEVHDKETDTFYILEGDATFVTGGKMVGGKTTAPGQLRGTGIDGGQTMQLHKGDIVVIPAGTPHWFKDVPTKVVYYTVKAIRP